MVMNHSAKTRARGASRGLFLIVLGALLLRLPTVWGTLPDIYWHDELNFIEGALRIGAGEIKGASFGGYGHGTLTYFILFAAFGLWFVVGCLAGVISDREGFILSYVTDPTALVLMTHLVMLAAGVGTVWLTYAAGKRLYGVKVGLWGAFLVAISFQSVQMTYGKEDGLFTFMLMLAFYVAIGILEKPEGLSRYVLTGAMIGAAAAVKYFGFLGLSLFAVGVYLSESQDYGRLLKKFLIGVLSCGVVFVCLTPGVLLDTDRFVRFILGMTGDSYDSNTGTLMASLAGAGAWYGYLWTTYALTGGIVLTLAFYGAACLLLWERSPKGLLLLVYPIALTGLLTVMMVLRHGAEAAYYQLSTVPFLCIAAGRFFEWIKASVPLVGRWVLLGLVGVVAVENVVDGIKYQQLVTSEDSRMVARKWIEGHVPGGTSVLTEGAIFTFVLEAPQLKENRKAIERDLQDIRSRGGTGRLWEAKLRVVEKGLLPRPAYDLHKVYNVAPEHLQSVAPEYVIVRNVKGKQVMDEGGGTYQLVFEVRPESPQLFQLLPMMTLADLRELHRLPFSLMGSSPIMPGPALWVYKSLQTTALH